MHKNDKEKTIKIEVEGSILFDTYELRILKAVRRIIRAVDTYSRKINVEHNITTPQLLCLHSIREKDGLTLSELSNRVNLCKSTTAGIVDRLEAKGLITRNRSKIDRRRVEHYICEKGLEVCKSAPPMLQDRFSEALHKLPELEQAAIALSLDRVVELMEADELDASPNLLPEGALKNNNRKEH